MFLKNSRILLFVLGLFLINGCSQAPLEIHITGPTMGTTYNVKFWSAEEHDVAALKARIDDELARINKLMSTYDPTSELSLFNQSKSTELHNLSADTLLVMREALRIGELSNGYLDITVGPLVNLWGFGPMAKPQVIPDKASIDATRDRIGLNKLVLSESGARKSHANMYIDLSPVAKGFGVDQVAAILVSAGVTNYLVEVGGELRLSGVNAAGVAWRVAIEKPITSERAVQRLLQPGDNALATSGDYRNYYEEDGRRYSHLIDPKTGYPIEHNLVSVSVIHPSSLVADGFATAINVMGKDAGLAMALENNLAVILITKEDNQFKEYTTPAFDDLL